MLPDSIASLKTPCGYRKCYVRSMLRQAPSMANVAVPFREYRDARVVRFHINGT